jgi:WD40 repeat protein
MRYTLAALVALFAFPAFAAEPPLPEGAVARLGTTKFRTGASALCLSPDGKHVALRVGDGIDVMNLDTGEVVAQIRDPKRLKHPKESRGPHWFTFAFASGGKEIVTAHCEPEALVWDAATGKFLRSIKGPLKDDPVKLGVKVVAQVSTVFNAQFADFVVCETWAGWQKLDVKTGKWSGVRGGYDRISDVSPDGRWVTDYTDMASVENYIGVTDTKTNKGVYNGESGGAYPFNSTPSPDGKLVACTTDEAGVEVWEIAGGKAKAIPLKDKNLKVSHGGPLFSPDGKTVISAAPNSVYDEKTPHHFARWDAATGERLKDWPMPARIGPWAVDHKNNRIVAVAGQCVFRLDIATGKLHAPPDGFIGYARPAISPDGKFVAVGDAAGVIRLWEAPFSGKPRTLREGGEPVDDLAFSKDGKALFAGHGDRSVSVWSVATGKQTAILNSPVERAKNLSWYRRTNVAVSPDGKTVVAEAESQALWAWDVATAKVLWKEVTAAAGRESTVTGCRPVFAPDGSALYYGRPKGEVSKLDPRTGKELARLVAPVKLKSWATKLAVSPDGKKLAVHTYYNQAELVLFDTDKTDAIWRQTFKLEDAVGGLAFGANGDAVVTVHADGTLRGWKAADGESAFKLRGPAGYVWVLQLTPDGKHAITDTPGATALVWNLPQK